LVTTSGEQRNGAYGVNNSTVWCWLGHKDGCALTMSEETTTIDLKEYREAWLRHLADEFLKLEPFFPVQNMFPDQGQPLWVQNVELEVGAVLFPVIKIKDELNLTPRRMGALIGHTCALGVWMMEGLEHELNKPGQEIELTKFTPEQIEHGKKYLNDIVNVWYPALRRLAKRALCSCVDRPYEDMTEFLLAYSEAFSRKPKKLGAADIGNPTFEIYIFMLIFWRAINALRSVHQLHQCLVRVFGPHRVGELKRVEKICQRIDLHYRKPGRPKKSEIIQTSA
jgi:hypothetical protein